MCTDLNEVVQVSPVAILNGKPKVGKPSLGDWGVFGGGEQTGIAASRVTCHNTFFSGLRPIWGVDRGVGLAAHKW